ncbi:MAG: hypothetical protein HMLKMBBP_02856 [Planctomycetes bacterium]|nr:hypothetical protein [Planctomycetota bacterium]
MTAVGPSALLRAGTAVLPPRPLRARAAGRALGSLEAFGQLRLGEGLEELVDRLRRLGNGRGGVRGRLGRAGRGVVGVVRIVVGEVHHGERPLRDEALLHLPCAAVLGPALAGEHLRARGGDLRGRHFARRGLGRGRRRERRTCRAVRAAHAFRGESRGCGVGGGLDGPLHQVEPEVLVRLLRELHDQSAALKLLRRGEEPHAAAVPPREEVAVQRLPGALGVEVGDCRVRARRLLVVRALPAEEERAVEHVEHAELVQAEIGGDGRVALAVALLVEVVDARLGRRDGRGRGRGGGGPDGRRRGSVVGHGRPTIPRDAGGNAGGTRRDNPDHSRGFAPGRARGRAAASEPLTDLPKSLCGLLLASHPAALGQDRPSPRGRSRNRRTVSTYSAGSPRVGCRSRANSRE